MENKTHTLGIFLNPDLLITLYFPHVARVTVNCTHVLLIICMIWTMHHVLLNMLIMPIRNYNAYNAYKHYNAL